MGLVFLLFISLDSFLVAVTDTACFTGLLLLFDGVFGVLGSFWVSDFGFVSDISAVFLLPNLRVTERCGVYPSLS